MKSFLRFYENELIVYEHFDVLLKDKIEFFKNEGFHVKIFEINEIENYTRDEYKEILESRESILIMSLAIKLINEDGDLEYLNSFVTKMVHLYYKLEMLGEL